MFALKPACKPIGLWFLAAVLALTTISAKPRLSEAQSEPEPFQPVEAGIGPYIADPDVIMALDCPNQGEVCHGPLNFTRLMDDQEEQTSTARAFSLLVRPDTNAFNHLHTRQIVNTIETDLTELRRSAGVLATQMSLRFLKDPGSRIELVGVINRMDRQFNRGQRESECGEISAIYRFSYSIRDGKQESRLPVTMNAVFPATGDDFDCKTAAKRWLDALPTPDDDRSPTEIAADLVDPSTGPLAHLRGSLVKRIELNMQAFRIAASADSSNFGTKATYLIRVFRWDKDVEEFQPVALPNQISRDKLLCRHFDPPHICKPKQARRARLVAFLQDPVTVSNIDKGILDIPVEMGVLATRAVSISPGGSHRSGNQPYWNARKVPRQQIISDEEIQKAIDGAAKAGVKLSFIETTTDFRTRLNDSTCTGCHQTRAIAGFHFPGSDRTETPRVNAVLLAGSPHFYGDQPRRMAVIRAIAAGNNTRLPPQMLATSYSARPMARYEEPLKSTQLIGGWGAACMMPQSRQESGRKWGCRSGLRCVQVFKSENDPGMGTCVPDGRQEIGDPLQQGTVKTRAFGHDRYRRTVPKLNPSNPRDTRIPTSALPSNPPQGNSYFGAHQEWYAGQNASQHPACRMTPPKWPDCYDIRRDQATGGFPAGMLRLSECLGLPGEATCGLTASSGFNACIGRIRSNPRKYSARICFRTFTSFAAVRACDYANPCRDDYICIKPMEYTADTYDERLNRLRNGSYFRSINGRDYDIREYGQKRPDAAWVARNDPRGMCIPPYFVFQFRSDGHPGPPDPEAAPRFDGLLSMMPQY